MSLVTPNGTEADGTVCVIGEDAEGLILSPPPTTLLSLHKVDRLTPVNRHLGAERKCLRYLTKMYVNHVFFVIIHKKMTEFG